MKKIPIYILSIGTTKLVAVEGCINQDTTLEVERFVKVPALGFADGIVANVEQASQQLRELISKLGEGTDYSKVDFHVVLSNEYVRTYQCSSSLYFGEMMRPVTQNDILKVIAQTKSVSTIPLDEYIIDEIPQEFMVNDLGGIINPLELEARRLSVQLLLFTVDGTVMRNISKVLDRADISPFAFIPKVLAGYFAVLREEEKRDGIVLVDIGGTVSNVLYIKNSVVQYYRTIAIGAEHISAYLAKRIGITQPEARRLKEHFGAAAVVSSFEDEIIPVVDIFGKTRLSLNKKRLHDQIYSSAKELLVALQPTVEHVQKKIGTVAGVVITGGGASLDGMVELSQEVFGTAVRLGVARKIHVPEKVISSPRFTSVVGVLGYVADQYKKDEDRFRDKGLVTKKIMQVKEWIQEYF